MLNKYEKIGGWRNDGEIHEMKNICKSLITSTNEFSGFLK